MYMGLFNLKKKEPEQTKMEKPPAVPGLNLKKDGILNLDKVSPDLRNLRLAAGWDMVHFGSDYDLDLCAYLLDSNGNPIRRDNPCIYYGKKHAIGIYLDKDNLTGEGDGDDENIFVNLDEISSEVEKIVFAVVIYNANGKSFRGVKNAYVRLVNTDDGDREICRYNLTKDGGEHTAVVVAELYRDMGAWSFKARGEYENETIHSLAAKIR